MKKYDKYKEYLYDWLPAIPAHWEEKSLRNYFFLSDERKGENTDLELLSVYREYGVIPKASRDDNKNVESEDTSKYKVVHKTDLVINKMKLWQGSLGISQYEGFVSPAYIVAHNNFKGNLRYLNLFLRSPLVKTYYNRISYGIRVGQWDSDFYSFKQLIVPVPPKDEQDQIVRYLDWQISRINHLIHGYQKQIKLLDERKTTVINEAVTRGIHADVEMQAVEANWVKEIPAHWEFNKIKQHFGIKKRIAGKEGYDVISITQQGLKVKDIASNEGQMAANYSKYQFVYPGDYAMNHMDLLTGFIGLSDIFGVTSPDYRVFSAIDVERTNLKYFLYVFQLGYKRKIFYGLGRGAANKGRWRMPAINFKNYDIPVPPIEEQREIVEYIEQETEKIDLLKREVEKQIEYLREYRTRLISDVVTGQIDVRDVVIPEYTPEEDTEIDTDDIGEGAEEVAEDAE